MITILVERRKIQNARSFDFFSETGHESWIKDLEDTGDFAQNKWRILVIFLKPKWFLFVWDWHPESDLGREFEKLDKFDENSTVGMSQIVYEG